MSGYGYEFDASSFFMFESTGDSEVDARPAAEHGTVAMEEDDAESCSYDDLGSERSDSYDFVGIEGGCCDHKGGGGGNTAAEEDVRRDEEGGGGGLGRYKSCVSEESKSGGEYMNEMERNKLFWEACLAS